MAPIHLLTNIFLLELATSALILSLGSLLFYYLNYKEEKTNDTRKNITEAIQSTIEQKCTFEDIKPIFKNAKFRNLLHCIELLDLRMLGDDWDALKKQLFLQYLWPKGKPLLRSRSPIKRNWVARCIALCPLDAEESALLYLLQDQVFSVRLRVAFSLAEIGTLQSMTVFIRQMSYETSFSKYLYKDAISLSKRNLTPIILEILQTTEEANIRFSCLELLSLKPTRIPSTILEQLAYGPNPKERSLIAKILYNVIDAQAEHYLIQLARDPIEEVRAEAATSLSKYKSTNSLKALEFLLHDSSSKVSLKAAIALSRLGTEGRQLLYEQSPEKAHITGFALNILTETV